jgi:ferredoxin
MPTITAETATGTVTFDCEAGKKLVLALEDNGVDILHRCGGNARCTTCRVEILGGDEPEMGVPEIEVLTAKGALDDGVRLSCQIRVAGDMRVKALKQASVEGIDAGGRPED